MNHVMLDLETFGTRAGCVVRSIGAAQFDLNGNVGASFYANIDKTSCQAVGLTIDSNTAAWWEHQSPEAKKALLVDPKPLSDVAKSFNAWFVKTGADYVWAHGAGFDTPIWEAASLAARVGIPWKFWNVRDTRTVFDLFGFDIRDIRRDGTYHNAEDDARYQIACVAAALRKGRAPATTDAFA